MNYPFAVRVRPAWVPHGEVETGGNGQSCGGSCNWWNWGDGLMAPALEAHEGLHLGASEAGSQRVRHAWDS